MSAAQLRYSPLQNPTTHLAGNHRFPTQTPHFPPISLPSTNTTTSSSLLHIRSSNPNLSHPLPSSDLPISGGGSTNNNHGNSGGGSGGGWGPDGTPGDHHPDEPSVVGPLGLFLQGWRSRVSADPQFPFKVLMEELVGVTACVLGDMASRPNFGLNELDFVFSTLVVGSILNFVLMYLLAPTSSSASSLLPGLFSSCPASHMFEPGSYSLFSRLGTFVYKGVLFAAVGFAAGLAGTALSNGMIALRKRLDPEFETPNKAPPTVLNAMTWALHMGLSSNLRYQTLNGVEFVMAKALPPAGFKASVVVLRCLNNLMGGVSFVVLARMTGSQKVQEGKGEEEEKLIGDEIAVDGGDGELQRSENLTADRLQSGWRTHGHMIGGQVVKMFGLAGCLRRGQGSVVVGLGGEEGGPNQLHNLHHHHLWLPLGSSLAIATPPNPPPPQPPQSHLLHHPPSSPYYMPPPPSLSPAGHHALPPLPVLPPNLLLLHSPPPLPLPPRRRLTHHLLLDLCDP